MALIESAWLRPAQKTVNGVRRATPAKTPAQKRRNAIIRSETAAKPFRQAILARIQERAGRAEPTGPDPSLVPTIEPASIAVREKQRLHSQRLREDPAYSSENQQRIEELIVDTALARSDIPRIAEQSSSPIDALRHPLVQANIENAGNAFIYGFPALAAMGKQAIEEPSSIPGMAKDVAVDTVKSIPDPEMILLNALGLAGGASVAVGAAGRFGRAGQAAQAARRGMQETATGARHIPSGRSATGAFMGELARPTAPGFTNLHPVVTAPGGMAFPKGKPGATTTWMTDKELAALRKRDPLAVGVEGPPVPIPNSSNAMARLAARHSKDWTIPGTSKTVRALTAEVPITKGKTVTLAMPVGLRSRAEMAEFHANEFARIQKDVDTEYRGFFRDFDREQEPGSGVLQWIDGINAASSLGTIYLKPAYLMPQLFGQAWLLAVQHHFNPIELGKSAFQLGALLRREGLGQALSGGEKSVSGQIMGGTGTGVARAVLTDTRMTKPIPKALTVSQHSIADFWSWIVDRPERAMAFLYEARKEGFRNADDLERLFTPEMESHRNVIFSRANREMLDYANMSKRERGMLRRVVFFYPFMKAATVYGGRFVKEHPAQAYVQGQIGVQGEETAREVLGEVPSYARGIVPWGERDVEGVGTLPKVISGAAASILQTPGEALSAANRFAVGGISGKDFTALGEELGGFVNPLVQAGIAAGFGIDPFTKERIDPSVSGAEAGLDQLIGPYALRQLVEGLNRGEDEAIDRRLYPQGRREVLEKFVFGTGPPIGRPYNPEVGAERAQAETRSLGTREERWIAKTGDFRKELIGALVEQGMLPEGTTKLPEALRDAISLRSRREANYIRIQEKDGRWGDGEPYQRKAFKADLDLLVRLGKMSAKTRDRRIAWARSVAGKTISNERSRLGKLYFGGDTLSPYMSALRDRGVEIDLP